MKEVTRLPIALEISPSVLRFLDERFRNEDDLSRTGDIELEIRTRCNVLEDSLEDLRRRFSERIVTYSTHSERTGDILRGVRTALDGLRDRFDGGKEEGKSRELNLGVELPALAKEVARVESVRTYAEMTLKLDKLMGDVEDAVSSAMTGKLISHSAGKLEEMRQTAIVSLKKTEDILSYITNSSPQWTRLVSAVDSRVDRALSLLRPKAIADHRSLLTSLGWPPKLSSFMNSDVEKKLGPSNPLTEMQGDLKHKYCNSFLALCNLQEFQSCRKSRQLIGYNLKNSRQPLWAIEELVIPLALATQHHFSKWVDKPEFIFALVYKITRDFVDSMDDILQPLIDRARLVGYSCREEWIAAIVTSLSTYLVKYVFPAYIEKLNEENSSSSSSQARISWLSLIDSMITFDKRIQSLITNTGLLISVKEDASMQRISSLSVFCDRPDWLDAWAEIELKDALDKLKPELGKEKNWTLKMEGTSILAGSDDYKSPIISNIIIQTVSSLIDRSRPLPNTNLRSRFVKLLGIPVLQEFLDALLNRCQEAEGLTALADDDALIKVCVSMNAARYCESVLMEWSEDVFFIEMVTTGDDDGVADAGRSVFDDEINKLIRFYKSWLEKISAVILRGFDARTRDYLKNKKQWQEKGEMDNMSKPFVDALDYLQGKITKMHEWLNEVDFVALWRSLSGGIDQLLFLGTLGSNSKFYDGGVDRFRRDLEVLFGLFGAWCLRPKGFFPRLSEGLRLLQMEEEELKDVLLDGTEKWLKVKGLRKLNLLEAQKIAKNRVFN